MKEYSINPTTQKVEVREKHMEKDNEDSYVEALETVFILGMIVGMVIMGAAVYFVTHWKL